MLCHHHGRTTEESMFGEVDEDDPDEFDWIRTEKMERFDSEVCDVGSYCFC